MGQAMVQHAAAAAGGAAAAAGSKKVADGLERILGGAAGAAATAAAPVAPVVVQIPPTGKRGKPSPYEPQVNRAGGTEMAPVMTPGTRVPIPSPAEVEENAPAVAVSGEAIPGNSWVSRRPQSQSSMQSPVHQGPVPAFTPFVTIDGPVGPAVSRGSHRNAASGTPSQVATVQMSIPVAQVVPIPVLPPPPPPTLATPEKLAMIHEGTTIETVLSELGTPASKVAMYDDGKLLETLRIEVRGSRIGTIYVVNGVVTSVETATN